MLEHPPHQIGYDQTVMEKVMNHVHNDEPENNQITIKVRSLAEALDIQYKIVKLVTVHAVTNQHIIFTPKPGHDVMALAKLLQTPSGEDRMKSRGYLPCHTKVLSHYEQDLLWGAPEPGVVADDSFGHENDAAPTLRPTAAEVVEIAAITNAPVVTWPEHGNSMDLATQMAWLEGLSVLDDAPGQRHCMVHHAAVRSTVKYDPIGRPAIRQHLIEKYKVDISWDQLGGAEVKIYGDNHAGAYCILADSHTDDFGGCLGSAIVQCIINADRKK